MDGLHRTLRDHSPSSSGAGDGSFDFAASLGFAFAFWNDLKMSPTTFSFLALVFESDLFRVPPADFGCAVFCPEVPSSDGFSFVTGAATGFSAAFVAGFAIGLVVDVVTDLDADGVTFAARFYRNERLSYSDTKDGLP